MSNREHRIHTYTIIIYNINSFLPPSLPSSAPSIHLNILSIINIQYHDLVININNYTPDYHSIQDFIHVLFIACDWQCVHFLTTNVCYLCIQKSPSYLWQIFTHFFSVSHSRSNLCKHKSRILHDSLMYSCNFMYDHQDTDVKFFIYKSGRIYITTCIYGIMYYYTTHNYYSMCICE